VNVAPVIRRVVADMTASCPAFHRKDLVADILTTYELERARQEEIGRLVRNPTGLAAEIARRKILAHRKDRKFTRLLPWTCYLS
jgi:hypothetical protein